MGATASQITGILIIYSTIFSGRSKKIPKLRVTDIWKGNPPVTGGLPTQRASNAEMYLFDDVMMSLVMIDHFKG